MLKELNTCLWAIIIAILLCACEHEAEHESTPEYEVCRVAVVLPMEGGLEAHWHNTLELCAQNLLTASKGLDHGVKIEMEWYDELRDDLPRLAAQLSERDDIQAVIGGLYSGDAKVIADALALSNKPLFTPATTEQLVRAYSAGGNLWAMTETDITQCEVLLSKAMQYGASSVGLIADENSLYGQTFTDWFAFQAQELGLQHKGVWSSAGDIAANTREALASGADYIICAPSEVDEVGKIVQAYNATDVANKPKLLFSDIAYGTDVISALGMLSEGIEGVCFGSDPESGFDVAYEVYFRTQPTTGEAQIYDACMLIGYASVLMQTTGLDFRQAMRQLVDGREPNTNGWMAEDMHRTMQELMAGRRPDLVGASGNLNFDPKVYTNVTATVYANYLIYQQKYVVLDYNTTDGSKRADATLAGWNWKASQMQELGTWDDVTYAPLHERWALLVATSDGWTNYRHQADVLNIYQMLKRSGYDDGHIVLVVEDDIAQNVANPEPGVIRSRIEGENIYKDVTIDYRTSQLAVADLTKILTGESSEHLPEVLHADADDNVFFFWSGHGSPGRLEWLDTPGGFTADDAERMLSAIEEKQGCRKLLWMVETCFSGCVGCVVDNHPRMLCLTAANADETSKADIFDLTKNVWLSNRFTSSLQDCVTENSEMPLSDLYYRLFQNTVGSHVCVFGSKGFGNLHQQTLSEWFAGNSEGE